MLILRIGDPHVRPTNLDEWEKLAHFIQDKILEIKPDRVEILGDLFHTHAVLRMEVLDFWDAWLDILSEACELVVLVGNHDQTGNYESDMHALSVFKHLQRKNRNLKIVDLARKEGIYGYMPYTHSKDHFVELANGLASDGAKVLVCHQSFITSQFESGTYDPEGIDPALINFDLIISGHIHKHQICTSSGKIIIHPGTAMWHTNADANEDKGIWLYNHDDNTGAITSSELIRTAGIVTKIVELTWEEGKSLPAIPSGAKVVIELVGSSQWVSDQKKALKGQVSLKTKITDRVNKLARNPGKNFLDFISNVYVTTMDRTVLLKYMRDNGIV